MRKNLILVTLTIIVLVLVVCSATTKTDTKNKETLKLDTKWMGTYEEVDAFPYTTLEIIRYEDGSGKYVRTVYKNGLNEVLEGQYVKIDETKVADEANKVTIDFSDDALTFTMEEKNLAYKKVSPIVQEDFKLSNGLIKDMPYLELKEKLAFEETPEPPSGQFKMTSVQVGGIIISLHANTEVLEDAEVFGYRVKEGNVKTFRGIGIGSTMDEVRELYGIPSSVSGSPFIEYKVGQYSLIFDIADDKVREIHCENTM